MIFEGIFVNVYKSNIISPTQCNRKKIVLVRFSLTLINIDSVLSVNC